MYSKITFCFMHVFFICCLTQLKAEDFKETVTFNAHKGVYKASFNNDGKKIVSSGSEGTIRVWNSANGVEFTKVKMIVSQGGLINGNVSFTPDGKGFFQPIVLSPDKAMVWDVNSGREIGLTKIKYSFLDEYQFVYSPDRTKFVDKNFGTDIKVQTGSGKVISNFKGHTKQYKTLAFSPDSKKIISTSEDGIRLWDAERGIEYFNLKGHSEKANIALFTPDGKKILSASDDKTIKVWDATTGYEIQTLKGHNDKVTMLSISSDGKKFLSISKDEIKVWDFSKK